MNNVRSMFSWMREDSDVENLCGRGSGARIHCAICGDDRRLGAADFAALRGAWGKAGWRAETGLDAWTLAVQAITIGFASRLEKRPVVALTRGQTSVQPAMSSAGFV